MEEREPFQNMMLKQFSIESASKKQTTTKNPQPKSHVLCGNKLQMDHGLKCKHKTIKHLEKKKEKNLWDLGLGKEFLDLTPKAQSIKEKTC